MRNNNPRNRIRFGGIYGGQKVCCSKRLSPTDSNRIEFPGLMVMFRGMGAYKYKATSSATARADGRPSCARRRLDPNPFPMFLRHMRSPFSQNNDSPHFCRRYGESKINVKIALVRLTEPDKGDCEPGNAPCRSRVRWRH